jgi:uncharacterized protein (TIGR00369 family)
MDPRLERSQRMIEIANSCSYFMLIGLEVIHAREGVGRVKLVAREEHLNPGGTVHGGVITTIVDAAGGIAGMSAVAPTEQLTTAEIKLNFLNPARAGDTIVGEGHVIQLGRTLCIVEIEARTEDGRLIAKGLATLAVLKVQNSWV